MNLGPPDISLTFSELSLNEEKDDSQRKHNQEKPKPNQVRSNIINLMINLKINIKIN